jgi:hypothetical protein
VQGCTLVSMFSVLLLRQARVLSLSGYRTKILIEDVPASYGPVSVAL